MTVAGAEELIMVNLQQQQEIQQQQQQQSSIADISAQFQEYLSQSPPAQHQQPPLQEQGSLNNNSVVLAPVTKSEIIDHDEDEQEDGLCSKETRLKVRSSGSAFSVVGGVESALIGGGPVEFSLSVAAQDPEAVVPPSVLNDPVGRPPQPPPLQNQPPPPRRPSSNSVGAQQQQEEDDSDLKVRRYLHMQLGLCFPPYAKRGSKPRYAGSGLERFAGSSLI